VVRRLTALLRFRNACPAFDGEFGVEGNVPGALTLTWINGDETARLRADFKAGTFAIEQNGRAVSLDA
jgi:sucrose phosphorylase